MQKDRKKEHKKIVNEIRRRNKQLAEDEYIGLNRFRIDLYSEDFYRYSDGSGCHLYLIFKLTDNLTGNTAYFPADNYNYIYKLFEYANDFLIRCSDGWKGHLPALNYYAYDVHQIIPYIGRNSKKYLEPEKGVINTYSWIESIKYE